MLHQNTGQVPKREARRALQNTGRIKQLQISKEHTEQQVHDIIKSAFDVNEFSVLECKGDGHALVPTKATCIDGRFVIKRRGCLYLCEVSFLL